MFLKVEIGQLRLGQSIRSRNRDGVSNDTLVKVEIGQSCLPASLSETPE